MKIHPLIKTPINLQQTREELQNTNSDLTGRQLLPEHRKNKVNFSKNKKSSNLFPRFRKTPTKPPNHEGANQ